MATEMPKPILGRNFSVAANADPFFIQFPKAQSDFTTADVVSDEGQETSLPLLQQQRNRQSSDRQWMSSLHDINRRTRALQV